MSATITVISLPVEDPDDFEQLSLKARRVHGQHWTFPLGSKVQLDRFFMTSTEIDLGVYSVGEDYEGTENTVLTSYMIDRATLERDLPTLASLVEKNAAETAKKLYEHGKQRGELSRITAALASDVWPTSGDAADEAAAFAHYLLLAVA